MNAKSDHAQPSLQTLLDQHHREMARAAAAAMEKQYQETIEICAELLTSGIYEQMSSPARAGESDGKQRHRQQDASEAVEIARRSRAEVRLMMATAMHYTDGPYDDIARVLNFALDSPPEIQKDAYFTLAVVHLSFDHPAEARAAMAHALALIADLHDKEGDADGALALQEQEAKEFLASLDARTQAN